MLTEFSDATDRNAMEVYFAQPFYELINYYQQLIKNGIVK